jgi:hypothetical protein
MNTQELLEKLAKAKAAYESEEDPELKAKFKNKMNLFEKQIAEAETTVAQKEEVVEVKEEKKIDGVEEKLNKLKKLIEDEDDPQLRATYQKKIDALSGKITEVKEQIKEEKQELKEQKQEVKEAVKEAKSPEKPVRTKAIKKVKEVKEVREEVVKAKKKRSKELDSIMDDLNRAISRSRKLSEKYQNVDGDLKTVGGRPVDLKRDASRKAKPFGWRFKGKDDYRVPTLAQRRRNPDAVDYEARPNRADVKRKGKILLEDGGEIGTEWKLFPNNRYYRKFIIPKSDSSGYREITEYGVTESMDEMDNSYEIIISVTEKGKDYFENNYKGKYAKGGAVGSFPFLKFEDGKKAIKKLNNAELPKSFSYVEKEKTLYHLPNITGDWVKLKSFETKEEAIGWVKNNLKSEGFAEGGSVDKFKIGQKVEVDDSYLNDEVTEGMKTSKYATVLSIPSDAEELVQIQYESGTIDYVPQYILGILDEYAKGGKVHSVDLFEDYESQPKKLKIITEKWAEKYEDEEMSYSDTRKFLKEVQSVGYTFDYGLDNMPYGLRPKDVKINQLKGFEDVEEEDEYAKGGKIKQRHSRKKDGQRTAKPSGWRWKNEAIEKGLVPKSAILKTPSKYYRDLYPDYVYFENRPSKSDKKPSRKSISL